MPRPVDPGGVWQRIGKDMRGSDRIGAGRAALPDGGQGPSGRLGHAGFAGTRPRRQACGPATPLAKPITDRMPGAFPADL